MTDLQVFYSTRRAAKYEAENTDAGMIALGRDFAIDAMVKAEHKAAEGDPLGAVRRDQPADHLATVPNRPCWWCLAWWGEPSLLSGALGSRPSQVVFFFWGDAACFFHCLLLIWQASSY